jgi:hypothetical protein
MVLNVYKIKGGQFDGQEAVILCECSMKSCRMQILNRTRSTEERIVKNKRGQVIAILPLYYTLNVPKNRLTKTSKTLTELPQCNDKSKSLKKKSVKKRTVKKSRRAKSVPSKRESTRVQKSQSKKSEQKRDYWKARWADPP